MLIYGCEDPYENSLYDENLEKRTGEKKPEPVEDIPQPDPTPPITTNKNKHEAYALCNRTCISCTYLLFRCKKF